HRVWRGEAAILLPMIDQYRIAVSQDPADSHRSWKPFLQQRVLPDDRPDGTPLETAAEFGDIIEFLDGSSRTAALRELRRNVDAVRRIRNILAHYRPVEWWQFRHVCEQYWKYARAS